MLKQKLLQPISHTQSRGDEKVETLNEVVHSEMGFDFLQSHLGK